MSDKTVARKQKRQLDAEVASSASASQDTMPFEKRRRIIPTKVAKSRAQWISPTKHLPKNHLITKSTCKKQLFAQMTKDDNHIKQSELIVRRSFQKADPMFIEAGKQLGKGVFMPRLRGGTTTDITLFREDMRYMRKSVLLQTSDWRLDYAVMDLYHDDMVYVPSSKDINNILFRVQHSSKDPSHALYQPCSGLPRLVCKRELQPGEELTFNYNLTPDDCDEVYYESSDPEDLGASFSIGTQVGAIVFVVVSVCLVSFRVCTCIVYV